MFEKLRFLWAVLKAGGAAWRQIKRLDAYGVSRFSDAWWLELRKWIEIRVVNLQRRQDQGAWKLFRTDNQILRGMLLLMKSEHLRQVHEAKGILARKQAEDRVYDKPVPAYPCH